MFPLISIQFTLADAKPTANQQPLNEHLQTGSEPQWPGNSAKFIYEVSSWTSNASLVAKVLTTCS